MRGCQELFLQTSSVSHPSGYCWTHGRHHGFSDAYLYLIIYPITFAPHFTFYMGADYLIRNGRPAYVLPDAIVSYCGSLQRHYGAWATSPCGA